MKEKRSILARVFGLEIEAEWLISERTNIFLTACLPALITLVGVVIQTFRTEKLEDVCKLLCNDIFINALQLSLISCVFIVLFRSRGKMVLYGENLRRLRNYLLESADLRDKSDNQISIVLTEIKTLSKYFFFAWMAIWGVFLLYYAENLCASILCHFHICQNFRFEQIRCFLDDMLNFASSTAMFVVFVLLNSVVISFNKRREIARNGLEFSVVFVVLFGCASVVPLFFSFAFCGRSYYELQMYISFVLSIYSVFTFVLMLSKFNSIYLRIPRLFYYGLYLYAILQAYQFLVLREDALRCFYIPSEIREAMELVGDIYSYATLIGKFFLSMLLLWIVDDFRFLFYLVKGNLEISNSEYEKNVFVSYMKG